MQPGSSSRADGPPMFLATHYPELKQLGRRVIHAFLEERARYLRLVADARGQGSTMRPVSLVSSVKFELLKALVALKTFPGIQSVDNLKNDILKKWLENQDKVTVDTCSVDELDSAVKKKLFMKMKEPDASMRVMNVFTDYLELLSERKMDSFVEENPKLAILHIVSALRPLALKEKIENDLVLHKQILAKDWHKFYAYVTEKAVALDEFLPAIEQTYRKQETPAVVREPKKGGNKGNNKSRQLPTNPSTDASGSGTGSQDPTTKNATSAAASTNQNSGNRSKPSCLNTKTCAGKFHFMRDCPHTSIDDRKRLVREFRAKANDSNTGAAGAVKAVMYNSEQDGNRAKNADSTAAGRLIGKLADTVTVTVCGDYGADHAAMSEQHLAKLAEANVFVPILHLAEPIVMDLAIEGSDDKLQATANKKARLSLTLELPEGPMRMRNVEFIVFQERMPEVLMSRPLLVSMGFDLDRHLATVREQFHDQDFSSIGFTPSDPSNANADQGRLARLMYRSEEFDFPVNYLDHEAVSGHEAVQAESVPSEFTIGEHVPAEVKPHLERMIQEAVDNGLPEQSKARLTNILEKHADVFRLKLGTDPPVNVAPMIVKLEPNSKPVSVKVRRYTPRQSVFLQSKVKELERIGLVRRNPTSAWACAPLIVPKSGPEEFRFTTDLRPVNKVTVPHIWPMPDLEASLGKLKNKKVFALIDLCQCYWQFLLDADSQECLSFITPEGVFSPTRVPHGQRNAVSYCQSSIQDMCKHILDKFMQWLDDMLFHATTADELLNSLEEFFEVCTESGLKLHAAKCQLFLKEVRWCGRVISAEGVRMDPARLEALVEMAEPVTGDQLQQFVCAANWMRAAIPEFTKTMSPLSDLLEKAYQDAGRRTRRAVSKVKLADLGWHEEHSKAFQDMKTALANATTLAHPDSTLPVY